MLAGSGEGSERSDSHSLLVSRCGASFLSCSDHDVFTRALEQAERLSYVQIVEMLMQLLQAYRHLFLLNRTATVRSDASNCCN